MLVMTRCIIAIIFCAIVCVAQARAADPTTPASPSPAPSASPFLSLSQAFTGISFLSERERHGHRHGSPMRTQLANALLTVAHTTGTFRFSLQTGVYAFPVVGQSLNTFQQGADTNLYGWLPDAYVQYVPDAHWTISAGKLPTLLGQENAFTFQNINIQRGLVWNVEPVVSNGMRLAYTGSKLTATIEVNDGFYSQQYGGIEGALGWNPTSATSLQLAFIVPNPNTPGNPTAAVANKQEYDLMLTRQIGKLTLLPYALWVISPANAALGFTRTETAVGGALMGDYAFNDGWQLGARFEAIRNASAISDTSANADFVGYGPSSNATTFTLTPQYRRGNLFVRAEWSYVAINGIAGLGFGPAGMDSTQSRVGLELGFLNP